MRILTTKEQFMNKFDNRQHFHLRYIKRFKTHIKTGDLEVDPFCVLNVATVVPQTTFSESLAQCLRK